MPENTVQNNNPAIEKDNPYINKKTKAIPVPTQNIGIELDDGLSNLIAEVGLTGKVDLSSIQSFTNISQRRDQLYQLLDQMGNDSTIAAILETYAEDATEYNDNGQVVWVQSSDPETGKYITFLLDSMQVDKNIYKWVYSLCKYGDLYLQLFRKSEYDAEDMFFNDLKNNNKDKKPLNEDININIYKDSDPYVHYVEMVPNPAQMFELTRFGKTHGYIRTNVQATDTNTQNLIYGFGYQYKFKRNDINIYNGDKFVHACLEDNTSRNPEEVKLFLDQESYDKDDGTIYTVKRGQSLLYSAFKIWRVLSLLENSMLLNRVTKSAIVRLINVEVGDMPKEMVGKHLQGIKSLMEQKAALDTGNSLQEYTNPGPIENNIYVPTYNGKGAITADQIGGDVNIGQLPDIDYFTNKFFGSMRVPKQYYGFTDDGAGFNGGQSLSIISSRYAKMIKRIQNTVCQALTDLINLILVDKGLDRYVNQFTIHMQPPTTQEEIDRRDNESSKVAITGDILNLLSDVDDPIIKLQIVKSLVSGIITDDEVIDLIQQEIDKRTQQEDTSQNPDDSLDSSSDISNDFSSDFSANEPLDLDAELGLETPETNEIETTETETLPTPEETGIDMTINNLENNDNIE